MLNRDNTLLLVIDVQGKLATLMHEAEKLFDDLVKLIEGARILQLPIVWAEQLPEKLGNTVEPVRNALDGLSPIAKNTFSCCADSRLLESIKEAGRKNVLVCGIESHVCVYQTVVDLLAAGYRVHLVTDGVSSRTPQNKQLGIYKMGKAGAELTSVEMALFELLKVAEGDEFKKITKLVK